MKKWAVLWVSRSVAGFLDRGGSENPVFMRVPRGRPLGTRMDAGF